MSRPKPLAFPSRLLCVALCLLAGCVERGALPPPSAETIRLQPVAFTALSGWQADSQKDAIGALERSCAVFEKKDPSTRLKYPQAGSVADWLGPCAALRETAPQTDAQVRLFFETHFTPYRVNDGQDGLFTGYYQAQLRGALERGGSFQTPLWARPEDMLSVDLGAFRDSLKGQKITGKIKGTQFVPYDERKQVATGSLQGRAKPLVWVDDPVGAFFLEVQGSGQILLPDGQPFYVGYDAQNGHGYTPIGRVLAEQGELEKPVTMQKIRAWLELHPDKAQDIMNQNASVVFFRKQKQAGAIGAQGVPLTPERSLAVDPAFVSLGTPVWLQTTDRTALVIAQDTGGAIKGPVRGDLFWGPGPQAEAAAGVMQDKGTYFFLFPSQTGAAR